MNYILIALALTCTQKEPCYQAEYDTVFKTKAECEAQKVKFDREWPKAGWKLKCVPARSKT